MRIPKKWRDSRRMLNHFVGSVDGVVVSKYWLPRRRRWCFVATPECELLWEIAMVKRVKKMQDAE